MLGLCRRMHRSWMRNSTRCWRGAVVSVQNSRVKIPGSNLKAVLEKIKTESLKGVQVLYLYALIRRSEERTFFLLY